jgi:hypothetical protein
MSIHTDSIVLVPLYIFGTDEKSAAIQLVIVL